jgi:hypothetical protein
MDRTGKHHLKWNYPGSENQRPHVFSYNVEYRPNTNAAILWKTVRPRGGYTWEREGKIRNFKCEYGWYTSYIRMNI